MLKKLFTFAFAAFVGISFAQDFRATDEEYDTSPEMINAAVHRTKYFVKDTFFASSLTSQEFLKEADREKPTVIYLHGCNRSYRPPEDAIRKFYLGLGFNFAETNFIDRGDAKPACQYMNGTLVVRANYTKRLPARIKELNAHVEWLKANNFKKIYVVGYSEGGMVIQFMKASVDAAIIHAMSCMSMSAPTKDNKYLQLISTNDPFLSRQGAVSCQGFPDRETFSYAIGNANTHDPFSDPSWAQHIKQFLGVEK